MRAMVKVTLAALVVPLIYIGAWSASGGTGRGIPKVHPVVAAETKSQGLLLGGTVDGKWVNARTMAPKLSGKEVYRLYSESRYLGKATGSKPKNEDGYHFLIGLPQKDSGYEIAIACDWNAVPRKPKAQPTTRRSYKDAVRRELAHQGLQQSPVHIKRVQQVDLEGDGKDEVLISAESSEFNAIEWQKGQYSFVLLQKPHGSAVKTFLLAGEFHKQSNSKEYPEYYNIAGLWDVDGDGELEIGIYWSCQRADVGGIALYDLAEGKSRLLVKDGIGH